MVLALVEPATSPTQLPSIAPSIQPKVQRPVPSSAPEHMSTAATMIYSPENDAAGDAHQEILNAERKRTRQLEADMDALRCTHVAEMDAAQSANQKLTSEFNTLKELCEEQQKQLAQLAEKLNALANSSEATSPGKETEQPSPPETLPSPPNPPMEHAARAYLESKLASSASPDVIPSPSCPGGADMAPADMAPPPPVP